MDQTGGLHGAGGRYHAGRQYRAPLYEAAPAPLTPAQRDEARAYSVAPLVFGGVSGASPRVDPRQLRPLAEAPERPRVERSVTIGRRGLAGALRNAGVDAAEVAEVTRLLAGLNPGGSARAELVLGRRETKSVPRPLESLALRARSIFGWKSAAATAALS